MGSTLLTVIAVNLGILLLASWVVCIVIFIRILKDKEAVEVALQDTKNKLKDAKKALQNQPQTSPPIAIENSYPLEPVIPDTDNNSLSLLETISGMSNDLLEKEQQLEMLAQLHREQQQLLEDQQASEKNSNSKELSTNHKDTQDIIEKLKHDLLINQRVVSQLETKLRDGTDKDGRIAVLEETEKRLRGRIQSLKQNQEQTVILAEGLRKANEKKQALIKDNEKLKRNIKELSNASQEQLATINKISSEVEKLSNLEEHQRNIISSLEIKLQSEKTGTNDVTKVSELEKELQHLSDTLDRTLREKEFIESYLLELDKTLEASKETEEALERAQKEIETLEMYFPEFENTSSSNAKESLEETHEPLQKLSINPEQEPELFSIISDNRLFGVLQEFWMTLDTPPLNLISESDIARPKNLEHWLTTEIGGDQFQITIGASKDLTHTLAKAMFQQAAEAENEHNLKDALGELGNVIAGTLANELNPDFNVGISEHLNTTDAENSLLNTSVAAEVLINANRQPLYIALVKTQGKD